MQTRDSIQASGRPRRRRRSRAPAHLRAANELRDSRQLRLLKVTAAGIAGLLFLTILVVQLMTPDHPAAPVVSAAQEHPCSNTYFTSANATLAMLPCEPASPPPSDSAGSQASLP
jgi:hypothetical protein